MNHIKIQKRTYVPVSEGHCAGVSRKHLYFLNGGFFSIKTIKVSTVYAYSKFLVSMYFLLPLLKGANSFIRHYSSFWFILVTKKHFVWCFAAYVKLLFALRSFSSHVVHFNIDQQGRWYFLKVTSTIPVT